MALLSAHHWLGNQADCGKEQMRQGGRQCNLVAEEGRGRVCAAKKKEKNVSCVAHEHTPSHTLSPHAPLMRGVEIYLIQTHGCNL